MSRLGYDRSEVREGRTGRYAIAAAFVALSALALSACGTPSDTVVRFGTSSAKYVDELVSGEVRLRYCEFGEAGDFVFEYEVEVTEDEQSRIPHRLERDGWTEASTSPDGLTTEYTGRLGAFQHVYFYFEVDPAVEPERPRGMVRLAMATQVEELRGSSVIGVLRDLPRCVRSTSVAD
jgi:hypothetical protein